MVSTPLEKSLATSFEPTCHHGLPDRIASPQLLDREVFKPIKIP